MLEPAGFAPRSRRAERLVTALVWSNALLVFGAFLWLLGDLLVQGAGELSWSFLVEAPAQLGRAGGIGPILVSTLLLLLVCLCAALPLGLATGILLAEYTRGPGHLGRIVRASLDVLAGVPSIVFGLFGNAFFCLALGMGFSILSGGLTLACMVLPILVRSIELGLRAVPDEYRLAGAALGLSRTSLVARVLLPAAAPGLAAGLVLGIGRALAETAALIFTSGYVDRMPSSLLDSGRALAIHVYELAMNVPRGAPRAHAAALVLILVLAAAHAVSSWCTERLVGRRVEHA